MTTDERLDEVMSSLKAIESHLERTEKTTAERFAAIDSRLDRIDAYLLQFRSEVISRLDVIDNRLDTLSSVLATIDLRLPPLTKALLDFGSVAARLTRDHAQLEEKVSSMLEARKPQ